VNVQTRREPAPSPPARVAAQSTPAWREVAAAPAVALVTVVAGLIATHEAGFSFRDPDNVAAGYFALVGAAVLLLVGLDVWLRAARRTGSTRPPRAALEAVRRERWTRRRAVPVAIALLSFYVTYLAYRNLKGALPLLRPGDLFDAQLTDADKLLAFGHEPWELSHAVLGGWLPTQILSTFYAAFIVFLPLTLALALVFSPSLQGSLFYATTLSVNWVLGIVSYYLLPSLGPVYAQPGDFAGLPHSEVTRLQEMLLDQRTAFLADTASGTPQAIAAFASLHIAMSFAALLMAYLLRLGRRWKVALWGWLGMTWVATVHFGWHYVVDDVAGLAMGGTAILIARALTGIDLRRVAGPAR
jgi:hypothetical protein